MLHIDRTDNRKWSQQHVSFRNSIHNYLANERLALTFVNVCQRCAQNTSSKSKTGWLTCVNIRRELLRVSNSHFEILIQHFGPIKYNSFPEPYILALRKCFVCNMLNIPSLYKIFIHAHTHARAYESCQKTNFGNSCLIILYRPFSNLMYDIMLCLL